MDFAFLRSWGAKGTKESSTRVDFSDMIVIITITMTTTTMIIMIMIMIKIKIMIMIMIMIVINNYSPKAE